MALTKTPIELSSTPGIVDNSNATAITIDASENVIIGGTTAGDAAADNLTLVDSGNAGMTIQAGDTSYASLYFKDSASPNSGYIQYKQGDDFMRFATNGTERMRIDASGNVGIGQAPSDFSNWKILELKGGTAGAMLNFENSSSTRVSSVAYDDGSDSLRIQNFLANPITFETNNTERMRIDASGALLVGTTSSDNVHDKGLKVVSNAVGANILDSAVSITGSGGDFYALNMMGGTKGFGALAVFSSSTPYVVWRYRTGTSDTDIIRFDSDGDVVITGAISKGSGSFKIDHPLPAKAATHHLVHSFIEGPQADNIYRGKIDLVDGAATVNIDTEAGMTEGTYVVLNTNTQCFTSNESGWTAVKGSVSGNTLTITAQESCTDTISWMVIGERKDPHMVNAKWTDDDGKVIVEPLKENN